MEEHQKLWNPLSVDGVAEMFATASFPWWIAGGLAMELAIGSAVREHSDTDVLVLRRDASAIREFLETWDCWIADPPGSLRPWPLGEKLSSMVHDIWCRKSHSDDWRLQLMVDEAEESDWVSRRDAGIRAPLASITRFTADGVRYLAPHVQLFYKAKAPRDKDHRDFEALLESGESVDKSWLCDAIVEVYGLWHPWLERLRA